MARPETPLADHVRAAKRAGGFKNAAIIHSAGISQATLSRMIAGRPHPDLLPALAAALEALGDVPAAATYQAWRATYPRAPEPPPPLEGPPVPPPPRPIPAPTHQSIEAPEIAEADDDSEPESEPDALGLRGDLAAAAERIRALMWGLAAPTAAAEMARLHRRQRAVVVELERLDRRVRRRLPQAPRASWLVWSRIVHGEPADADAPARRGRLEAAVLRVALRGLRRATA